MSAYLDTSTIVSLLASEPRSGRVDAWLRAHEGDGLLISPWVIAEVASAFAMKIRTGEFTIQARADAVTAWERMRRTLTLLPITDAAFETAARFAGVHQLGLRAADALHLGLGGRRSRHEGGGIVSIEAAAAPGNLSRS